MYTSVSNGHPEAENRFAGDSIGDFLLVVVQDTVLMSMDSNNFSAAAIRFKRRKNSDSISPSGW